MATPRGTINGSEAVIKALTSLGIEVVFANPGTTEMWLVSALDKAQGGVRCILGALRVDHTRARHMHTHIPTRPNIHAHAQTPLLDLQAYKRTW